MTSRFESVCLLAAALTLTAGCARERHAAGPDEDRPVAPAASVMTIELPASAAPAKELAPLSFMAGRWIGVNPNKTVNEEHWMAPRGNHMLATFRQVRRDGKPAFVEISLVSVEADGVLLRLRHLHGGLEVPEKRADLSVFRLASANGTRAEFTGTGAAEEVTAVVYELTGPDQLSVTVRFAATSKEKPFTSVYTRSPE
jgi:hypothetical protein